MWIGVESCGWCLGMIGRKGREIGRRRLGEWMEGVVMIG